MTFLDWATSHGIIILILPPHSTYKLQPLDVGVFQPLASAYTKQLNKFIFDSQGLLNLKKRHFWSLFRSAYLESFSEENIISAFANAGIWPLDQDVILNQLKRRPITPPPILKDEEVIKTPYTAKAIRQLKLSMREEVTRFKTEKLFKALDSL